jgi:hypothetical protein
MKYHVFLLHLRRIIILLPEWGNSRLVILTETGSHWGGFMVFITLRILDEIFLLH